MWQVHGEQGDPQWGRSAVSEVFRRGAGSGGCSAVGNVQREQGGVLWWGRSTMRRVFYGGAGKQCVGWSTLGYVYGE